MVTINVTAENKIIASNSGHMKNPKGLGMAGDALLFDGVAPVAYRVQGSKVTTNGRMVETDPTQYTVPHALRREVTRRQIEASGGRLRIGDAAWELPTLELAVQPREGDAIFTSAGERWSVLSVDQSTHGTRWRVFARVGA